MARNEQKPSGQGYKLLTVQHRMARAALAWGLRDLAGAARLSADTLPDLTAEGTAEKYHTGDQALEKAGCEFICEDDVSGPGVRLRKKQVRIGG